MLHRVACGTYHFRRRVPDSIRTILNKNEIWVSLKTANRQAAQARAGLLYARVQEIFEDARTMAAGTWVQDGPEDDPYEVLLIAGPDGEPQVAQVSLSPSQLRDRIARLSESLTAGHEPGNSQALASAQAQIDRLMTIASQLAGAVSAPHAGPAAAPVPVPSVPALTGTMFAEAMAAYTEQKRGDYKNDRDIRGLEGNLALFLEICGNKPVTAYDGKSAALFIDTVRRLPASFGKGPRREGVINLAANAIAAADAREARGETIDRMGEMTVEKKVVLLKGMWEWMQPRDMVEKNIWRGFKFKTEQKTKRVDWTEENLLKLLSLPIDTKTVSRRTYAYATAIGAYTGMRLGEICHLRPYDFIKLPEGWFIMIQEHPPTKYKGQIVKFSPKTEAGERAVPVHPALAKLGLIKEVERLKAAGVQYLFPDLTPRGRDGLLTGRLQQAFSRHKILAGVTKENSFHSFRHSVSTILRNEDTSIREVWIDAVLGHHGSSKSTGATTYLHKIGPLNLIKTVKRIRYPESIDFARLFDGPGDGLGH
ncbi:DUF6538 domain-containing protein [Gluconobacter oxydans]|uniref:DUF6538 domain-containing protein n=1 Tax=Gluconobacter oxydans TaxID=442 RepID=UPI0039E7B47C